MQECWIREAKERPTIHAVLKRLQVLYKGSPLSGRAEGHVSASSPMTHGKARCASWLETRQGQRHLSSNNATGSIRAQGMWQASGGPIIMQLPEIQESES